MKTNIEIDDDQNDIIVKALSTPKISGAKVSKLWSYNTGATQTTSVAISDNGRYIVAGIGTNVTLFDRSSNQTLWNYNTTKMVRAVAISALGEYIVTGVGNVAEYNDYHLYLFNWSSTTPKTPEWKAITHDPVKVVDISADGMYIVAGTGWTGYKNLFFFNRTATTPKTAQWKVAMGSSINSVAISASGEYFITGCRGGGLATLFFYNQSNINPILPQPQWSYNTNSDVLDVEISTFGDYIVAGTGESDDSIYLFNKSYSDGNIPMWKYTGVSDIKEVAISTLGDYIVANDDLNLYFLDNSFSIDKKSIWNYTCPGKNPMSSDISGDGKYITLGLMTGGSGTLHLLDKSSTTPKTQIWDDLSDRVDTVRMSILGDYIIARTEFDLHLFYHDIPILYIPYNSDDDDDSDDKAARIPYGNHYLLFIVLAMISLIITTKRKVIFKSKK